MILFKHQTRWQFALGALTMLSVLLFAVACMLTVQVFLKLDEYSSARVDNMQWTISQIEVDHAKFLSAAKDLHHARDGKIDTLRRRYNGFYSRVDILEQSQKYAAALSDERTVEALEVVRQTLTELMPIFDGSDSVLVERGHEVEAAVAGLAEPVREISIQSVGISATQRDLERAVLSEKLWHLILLSLLTLAALFTMAILLWRLGQRYRRHAADSRATRNRLSTILNTSQDTILVVRKDGSVATANRAAKEKFALVQPGGTLKNVDQVLRWQNEQGDLQPVTGEMLFSSCANGPNRCSNLTAVDGEGKKFPVEMSADLASHSHSELCVCFLRDISRRLAAQTEVEQARDKALAVEREKARFLGVISHEMRTPLTGLLGALDLLGEYSLTADQSQLVKTMKNSGDLLLNRINEALDLTVAGAGKLALKTENFDLDQLIDEVVSGLEYEAHVKNTDLVVAHSEDSLQNVCGDRDRVQQVLLNLVSNAIKFTDTGQVSMLAFRPTSVRGADMVEIHIRDTGIGINQSDVPRIFEDFVRLPGTTDTEEPGIGLGLGIVRQLVELMGGEIGVDSEENAGSLFWVRLPLPVAKAQGDTLESSLGKKPGTALNILLAEDNETSRFVLTEMLRQDGHAVVAVTNGKEALSEVAKTNFDLILMDVWMPEMNGIEATRKIRQVDSASNGSDIVFLTAYSQGDRDAELFEAGGNAVCSKPIRLAQLRALLAGQQAERSDVPLVNQERIDMAVLEQLQDLLPQRQLDEFVERFTAEGDTLFQLGSDWHDLSCEQIAERLHAFAGSAAVFGALALQNLLSSAEAAALDSDKELFLNILAELDDIWQGTRAEIELLNKAA